MKKSTSIGMLAAIAFAVGMTGINLSEAQLRYKIHLLLPQKGQVF